MKEPQIQTNTPPAPTDTLETILVPLERIVRHSDAHGLAPRATRTDCTPLGLAHHDRHALQSDQTPTDAHELAPRATRTDRLSLRLAVSLLSTTRVWSNSVAVLTFGG
jgi:hypothetical protein